MNRRELLSGMACGVLAGGSALAAAKEVVSRPTEWLNKWLPRLPQIAKVQAQVKSQGAQLSKDVLHGLPWHPGVTLLMHRSRASDAAASYQEVRELLRKNGIQQLAVGWSDDNQSWAQFVLADSTDVQQAVAGHVRACIGVETRSSTSRAA